MKIGLIGPTNLDLMSEVSNIDKNLYIRSAQILGEIIAKLGHDLVIVPDRGVAVEGLKSYRIHEGNKVIAIWPQKGETSYQLQTIKIKDNIDCCDEVITELSWHEQHSFICQISDLMVCCGISCGTISEIAWSKWVEGPTIYICKNTVSCIPAEIVAEAHIKFIDKADDFEQVLKNL